MINRAKQTLYNDRTVPYVFVSILLFIAIFYPPFFNQINMMHIAGGIAWIYLLVKRKQIKKVILVKRVLFVYASLILFSLYILLQLKRFSNPLSSLSSYLFWMVDILPVGFATAYYLNSKNMTFRDLTITIIIAGLIESITSVAALLFPEVRQFFVSRLIAYGFPENMIFEGRTFGFGMNLTSSASYALAIIAVVILYFAFFEKRSYIWWFPLPAVAALANTRTTIVVLLIGLVLLLVHSIRYRKLSWKQMVWIVAGTTLIAVLLLFGLRIVSNDLYIRTTNGFIEIVEFITGSYKNNPQNYFNFVEKSGFFELPSGIELVFGTGAITNFGQNSNVASDIGYVNDIWKGGIVYLVLFYCFIIYLVIQLRGVKKSELQSFLSNLFLLSLIVLNIKANAFSVNEVTTIFLIAYVYEVCIRKSDFSQSCCLE